MAFLDRDFIACLKCSQDCFQWHTGNVMARPHIAPSCFTLLQDICLLRIPRQFSASFLGKCSGQVQLEGPAGKGWCAELKREKDFMTFANPGWSAFVEDFKLQIGDGLLFTYLGRNIFKVRIFDLEGIEKGFQGQSIIECPSQAYITGKDQIPLEIDKNIPIYDDFGPYDDHKENKISNEAFGVLTSAPNTCNSRAFGKVDNEEQGNDEITYARCEDDHLISPCFGDYKEDLMGTEHEACQFFDCGLTSNYKVMMNEGHNLENLQEATMVETGGCLSKIESIGFEAVEQADSWHKRRVFSKSTRGRPLEERPNISEMLRQHLICAANAFKSPYPIARKSLKPSYDHKMILPKLFVEKFMPKRIASLTLTDPQGEDWPCKWLGAMKAAGAFVPCISAGWSQFAHTHQLKTDDILVFELIDQQSLHFRVHFFKPPALDVLSQPPFLLSSTPSLYGTKCHSNSCE